MRARRPIPPTGTPRAGLVYRFAAWFGVGVMRLQKWQFDVEGLEHVPQTGGALIAANHQSFWDFFAVSKAPYERYGRPVRIMAKQSLFDLPVFGRLMYRTRCIPVDRTKGAAAFLKAIEALQAGELVLILPEGTISRSFDLLPFRSGVVRIAEAAGVPVIPAATWGSHRFYTSGRKAAWKWRLPVTVRYGPAFTPAEADDVPIDALKLRVQAELDRAISAYPDGTPAGEWWVPARLGGGAPDHVAVEEEWDRTRSVWKRSNTSGGDEENPPVVGPPRD